MATRKTTAKTGSAVRARKPSVRLRTHLEKMLSMSDADRDVLLADAARAPLLGWNDVAYILQEIPPDFGDPDAAPMYIDEVKKAMDRLKREEQRDRIDLPIVPRDLVHACGRLAISLPSAFVSAASPVLWPSKNGNASTQERDQAIWRESRRHVAELSAAGLPFKLETVAQHIARHFPIAESTAGRIISKAGINWSVGKAAVETNRRKQR